jgi:hypothetical protein
VTTDLPARCRCADRRLVPNRAERRRVKRHTGLDDVTLLVHVEGCPYASRSSLVQLRWRR